MNNQLKEQYQLSVLQILATVSVLGITPFIFIRYFEGNTLGAALDLGLVLGIIGFVTYARYTGNPRYPSLIIAIFINSGVAAVIASNGTNSLLWIYPVCAVTYFLAKPLEAFSISVLNIIFLASLTNIFEVIPLVSFIFTSMIMALCAFVHSSYTDKQFRLLETLNNTDPLTGAFNRRALSFDLEAALANSERNGTEQLLVIVDLDHFKDVNDEFGHAVGDKILKQFVEITTAHIRKYDRLYRYGGEEFVLLVSGINQHHQHSFTNKLRTVIKNELKTPDGQPITVSLGAAVWLSNTTMDSWLKRADDALYQAKSDGRDRTVFCKKTPTNALQSRT